MRLASTSIRSASVGLALAALILSGCGGGSKSEQAVRAALKKQVRQGVRLFRRPTVDVDDIQPLARRFYRERGFRPTWTSSRGPTADATELVEALEAAPREGLDPAAYDVERIRSSMEKAHAGLLGPASKPTDLAALDLLLTRTFLRYAAHLSTGQVDPKALPADWHLPRRRNDLVSVLKQATAGGDVRRTLEALPPRDPRYARLREALERYRAVAASGGWKSVPAGPPLRRGQRGPRVDALLARLATTGEMSRVARAGQRFDSGTEAAVRRFQEHYGLDVDGVVGADDMAELNVPVETRIRQIELNLERWRWLPPLEDRYLIVNVPDYSLHVFERERQVLAMRVVVGKQYSRTPLFSDEITHVVLNPYWNVPKSIAAEELLPAVQNDDAYLEQRGIHVFDGSGPDAREVDPGSINWGAVSPEDMDLSFRQDPGPGNPVGNIKFMCPNQFDVYLHDTPANHLFDERGRDFSHGCIRLEKPVELAEYLLQGTPGSSREELVAAFGTTRDSSVKLPRKMPIHILYWTAWADERGNVQFRPDVYGLDRVLDRALRRVRPAPKEGVRA